MFLRLFGKLCVHEFLFFTNIFEKSSSYSYPLFKALAGGKRQEKVFGGTRMKLKNYFHGVVLSSPGDDNPSLHPVCAFYGARAPDDITFFPFWM